VCLPSQRTLQSSSVVMTPPVRLLFCALALTSIGYASATFNCLSTCAVTSADATCTNNAHILSKYHRTLTNSGHLASSERLHVCPDNVNRAIMAPFPTLIIERSHCKDPAVNFGCQVFLIKAKITHKDQRSRILLKCETVGDVLADDQLYSSAICALGSECGSNKCQTQALEKGSFTIVNQTCVPEGYDCVDDPKCSSCDDGNVLMSLTRVAEGTAQTHTDYVQRKQTDDVLASLKDLPVWNETNYENFKLNSEPISSDYSYSSYTPRPHLVIIPIGLIIGLIRCCCYACRSKGNQVPYKRQEDEEADA